MSSLNTCFCLINKNCMQSRIQLLRIHPSPSTNHTHYTQQLSTSLLRYGVIQFFCFKSPVWTVQYRGQYSCQNTKLKFSIKTKKKF